MVTFPNNQFQIMVKLFFIITQIAVLYIYKKLPSKMTQNGCFSTMGIKNIHGFQASKQPILEMLQF